MGSLPVVIKEEEWENTADEVDNVFIPDAEIWSLQKYLVIPNTIQETSNIGSSGSNRRFQSLCISRRSQYHRYTIW